MQERHGKCRREGQTDMGERGMRCEACGQLWFSAVARVVAARFRSACCNAPMHTDRRCHADRGAVLHPA